MELATGTSRYEFSGPSASGWYAAFVPDGSAFLASRLFEQAVNVWPTAHAAREDRAPPEPLRTVKGLERMPLAADVAATGLLAFALVGGEVLLNLPGGEAPRLAPHAGEGESSVAFTPSGGHIVALRAGRVHAWSLAEPTPAAREPDPSPQPSR